MNLEETQNILAKEYFMDKQRERERIYKLRNLEAEMEHDDDNKHVNIHLNNISIQLIKKY